MARNRTWVVVLTVVAIAALFCGGSDGVPLSEFVAWGPTAGDTFLERNDDYSTGALVVPGGLSFPFFNSSFTQLFVNNNGVLTFNFPITTYTPEPFPIADQPAVAVYWADVDTRNAVVDDPSIDNLVWYSYRSDATSAARVRALLASVLGVQQGFQPTVIFVATWNKVGFFSQHVDKVNTFQAILVTNGSLSFAIYQYLDNGIAWTTGDVSYGPDQLPGVDGLGGTPAQVGFDAGLGPSGQYFAVPTSRTAAIVNISSDSNVDIPGRFIFSIEGSVTNADVCYTLDLYVTPSTPLAILGGTELDDPLGTISGSHDCLAAQGTNAVLGGWTVHHQQEALCCATRGVLTDAGACVTGCSQSETNLMDFYVPAGASIGNTCYLNCYADVTTTNCLPVKPASGQHAKTGGYVVASPLVNPPPIARSSAVLPQGSNNGGSSVHDGAYPINIADPQAPAPEWALCTGRGQLNADGLCVMNLCGAVTANFIVVGTQSPPVAPAMCYFSCYLLP